MTGAQVEIVVADEDLGRRWIFESDGREWQVASAGTNTLASVAMTADDAWRLLTNNHRRSALDMITTNGDPTIVAALTRTRAIIGEPK